MAVIERDVIVAGAGPAGAICAAYLAKAGIDVLLLEKEMFPRDKACGDILREGISCHLGELGAIDELDAMSTCVRKLSVMSGGGRETVLPFECYCAPRYRLDSMLAETVVKHGAELRQGCRVLDVLKEQGNVTGVRAKWGGEESEIRAKIVIGADGAYSSVAKSLGVMNEDSGGIWMGERAYFKGVKLDRTLAKDQYDAYGVFAFHESVVPGYFWIMPVGADGVKHGICNIGMLLNDRDSYKGMGFQDRFDRWVKGSHKISAMLENAERISPWAGGRFGDITQRTVKAGGGFMLIGDAATSAIPLVNDGLSEAAASAKAASVAAMMALRDSDFSGEKLSAGYSKAFKVHGREAAADKIKETRLLMESMHDGRVMDDIIRRLEEDQVYRKKHLE